MKSKVLILVINYNYSKFILQRESVWRSLASDFDVVLVDDQSSDQYERELIDIFSSGCFVKTTNVKSKDNSINQLGAILCGCENYLTPAHTHLWVIDADDYPILDNIDILNDLKAKETYAFPSKLRDDAISKITTLIPKKKFFWHANLATSQLVISVEDFSKAQPLLRSRKFADCWFDSRLNLYLHSKIIIQNQAIVYRCMHGGNDSLRHSANFITRLKKYVSAFYLKWLITRM